MSWKKYYFNVFEFLERQIHVFVAKLSDRCFRGFPACHADEHQHGVSIKISINLGKKKTSPHILRKKHCCDLNLGESLCIFTFFLFKILDFIYRSVLVFILIYFERRDTENHQFRLLTSRSTYKVPTHAPTT